MVVVVFRYRPNPLHSEESNRTGEALWGIATQMPGFVSYKEFAAEDGECVSIVEFESHETLAAWRNQVEHRQAQQRGREALFTEYRISVCDLVRSSIWP